MLINIDQVSEILKLSKSVIKRLVYQETFPDPNLWDIHIIEKWSRSKRGLAVLKANPRIREPMKYKKYFNEAQLLKTLKGKKGKK